ncbi:MAG: His/Gly/Thr/Pro-type tRNA ligase C-terminal domain-containing protein [Patescibacteria group bacterium]|nr:His/Gly/Thr/Pro-type tRNA ligase C-terminal domain-containing protein [Patescibacteria group bacterium]
MRQTQLFTKTRREAPRDEVAKNAELLIRAGYIHKEMAGVYSYLPLGLRVLNKIVNIIRDEMNAVGGQELLLASLQNKETWERSDRWDDGKVDVWFKTAIKNGNETGLAFTHEEPLTNIMRDHIRSFRDLPIAAYQFQTKFRNEVRAKSGIMRSREFLMKDLYTFCRDEKEQGEYYERLKEAYVRVFDRLGIGAETFVTFASGGSFSKYSHEFQTITDAGEDIIYVDNTKRIAINKEVYNDEVLSDLGVNKSDLKEMKAVEVGNIFNLGTKFSDALGLNYKDENGESKPVFMGSYGIGPGRVMGTIVELRSDDKGIVWPESVTPFAIHLVLIEGKDDKARNAADRLYRELIAKNIEVLYDDRSLSAGEKFSDSDLIGIPKRYVISDKTLASGSVEVKDRMTGKVEMVMVDSVCK